MATTPHNPAENLHRYESFLKRFGPVGTRLTRDELERRLGECEWKPECATGVDALVNGSVERSARGVSGYYIQKSTVGGTTTYRLSYDSSE